MLSNQEIEEDRRAAARMQSQPQRRRSGPAPSTEEILEQRRRSHLPSGSENDETILEAEFFSELASMDRDDPASVVLQSARDAAAMPDAPEFSLASKNDSLEPIRQEIQRSRKPRMRTVEQYLCDQCDKIIDTPRAGFVIQGNIYVADPASVGGLIGNNFPDTDEPISVDSVKKTVLCKTCFMTAVGLASGHDYRSAVVKKKSVVKKKRRPDYDNADDEDDEFLS